MEKILSWANSFAEADEEDRLYYASLTPKERINIALQLMKPIYDAYPRFEKVYRVVEQSKCPVRDSWRLGSKQLPDS
jgi:lysyl-tRNA synthetase class I